MSIITMGLGTNRLITMGFGGAILVIEETVYLTLTPEHWLSKKLFKLKAKLIDKVESGMRDEFGELIEGKRTFYVYDIATDIDGVDVEREYRLFGTYNEVTHLFYIPANKEEISPKADGVIDWKGKKFRILHVRDGHFKSSNYWFSIFEVFCKEIIGES